jgi:hypothetical protein
VQINQHANHHSRDSKIKFNLWTNAYAAKNRVHPPPASDTTLKAADIPREDFLPKLEDRLVWKKRMTTKFC